MYFDKEIVLEYWTILALQNAAAYQNNKNVKEATAAARLQLVKEFSQHLKNLAGEVETEVYNNWYEEEETDQQRHRWDQLINAINEDTPTEVTAEIFDHYLNVMPPLTMGPNYFYTSEPLKDTPTGQCFWKFTRRFIAGKDVYFAQVKEVKHQYLRA